MAAEQLELDVFATAAGSPRRRPRLSDASLSRRAEVAIALIQSGKLDPYDGLLFVLFPEAGER
jgi:hypothetical protein